MSDVILINSFPNSQRKINILKEQISNLKLAGLPIILCSGCDIQKDIYDLVDYVFLNKEKIPQRVTLFFLTFIDAITEHLNLV